jgi:hypothetical protein
VPVGVTGHRTQRPRGQVGPPGPRTTPSPTQLLTEPRGRTAANTAASGPSDRAAGQNSAATKKQKRRERQPLRVSPVPCALCCVPDALCLQLSLVLDYSGNAQDGHTERSKR